MINKTTFKKLLKDDQGVIATEYVLFVAFIGTVLIVGVALLFGALSGLFAAWAGYFTAGS